MIEIRHLKAETVTREWWWMEPLLRPAVKQDASRDMGVVHGLLLSGRMDAWAINGELKGLLVTQMGTTPDDERCMWIAYAAGSADGGPKLRVARFRKLVREFEHIATDANCAEVRIEGRDWSRILPDYERTGDLKAPNELRKVLL